MTDLELATSKPPNENISDLWLGVQKTCTQVERLRVGGVGWCWVVPGGWRWAPRGRYHTLAWTASLGSEALVGIQFMIPRCGSE